MRQATVKEMEMETGTGMERGMGAGTGDAPINRIPIRNRTQCQQISHTGSKERCGNYPSPFLLLLLLLLLFLLLLLLLLLLSLLFLLIPF